MKYIRQTLLVLALSLVVGTALSPAAYAQTSANNTGNNPQGSNTIPNPFKCPGATNNCTLIAFFNAIIDNILMPIGAVAAVLAFIWAGFKFVTAQGDPTKIDDAKRALLYVAIGAVILLGARAIGEVIEGTIDQLSTSSSTQ